MDSIADSLRRGHGFALAFSFYALGVIVAARASSAAAALALVAGIAAVSFIITSSRIQTLLLLLLCAFVAGTVAAMLAMRSAESRPYAVLGGRHVEVEAVALERPRIVEAASLRARIVAVRSPATAAGASLIGQIALECAQSNLGESKCALRSKTAA